MNKLITKITTSNELTVLMFALYAGIIPMTYCLVEITTGKPHVLVLIYAAVSIGVAPLFAVMWIRALFKKVGE